MFGRLVLLPRSSALKNGEDRGSSPRTRHVTTILIIESEEDAGTTSRSYFTVFQQVGDFPLQPVASGRYRDRFERGDGAWRFTSREVSTDLVGDVSHHVKAAT